MTIPEKYITVVPLMHPGTPDGTLKQINPEYVEYLESALHNIKSNLDTLETFIKEMPSIEDKFNFYTGCIRGIKRNLS